MKTDDLVAISYINKNVIPLGSKLFEDSEFQSLWDKGILYDQKDFEEIYGTLHESKTSFPPHLQLKN